MKQLFQCCSLAINSTTIDGAMRLQREQEVLTSAYHDSGEPCTLCNPTQGFEDCLYSTI